MASSGRAWELSGVGTTVFRYALPCLSALAALLLQGGLQRILPNGFNFPYVLFYLLAALVSAWYGGYISGALACLLVMAGLPLAGGHFARMPPVDLSRLCVFMSLTLLIGRVAQMQQHAREILRKSNDELDHVVHAHTSELASAVESLQTEIAGHYRTEAALRESEERVAFALEGASIGRWDLDLETGQATRSLGHDQVFGYAELQPEWTYQMMLEHVLPEDRPQVVERFAAAAAGGNVWEFECRIQTPRHTIRWIWGRGKIRRDEAGIAVSMLGIVKDVTDRKRVEQNLRSQVERLYLLDQITRAIGERQDLRSVFQVAVGSLQDGLSLDFGCFCLYDQAAEVLTVDCVGVRSEALAQDLAMTLGARIAIDQNGLSRCVRGQLVYEQDVSQLKFAFPQRLSQGGLRAMVAAPLLVEGEVYGILIAARRKPASFSSGECEFLQQLSMHVSLAVHAGQVRADLQQAYDDLRHSQQTVMQQERLRALGQMASGIAHDINNALSPIALYTESLLEREPNLSARTREYLETTQRAIEDVAHTVGRMREFSRQREPQATLTRVDLNSLIQQVLDLTRARWSDMPQQRGMVIQVRRELTPDLPRVDGIESEVREALINLIFNAVDAMPDGGTLILRTKAVELWGDNGNLRVCAEVGDTGIGMDEQTRRRCLEPFFTTKGDRGTGLGLAMVYGVAARMNAQIEIESAVGVGTTVRLSCSASVSAAVAAPLTYVTAAPQRLRVLVVDDDPLIIRSLSIILETDGHSVTAAHGGQEGIDLYRAAEERMEPFAVVITDLGMPNVDGRTVATAVKAMRPATPVIMLTGWGQRMEAEQDIPSDVDRVLNKPPKLYELRSALRELVEIEKPDSSSMGAEIIYGISS